MGDEPIRVVGLSGSRRADSYTRVAIDRALAASAAAGAETTHLEADSIELPLLNPDAAATADVERLREAVRAADAILLGTPMYHGSYSGVLKNMIDHCGFDEFEDATVGLIAVAGGRFPITALEHLRSVCRALNAWVLPWEVAIPRARTVIEGDTFTDEAIEQRVDELGERAVEYARISPHQHAFESEENVGAAHR